MAMNVQIRKIRTQELLHTKLEREASYLKYCGLQYDKIDGILIVSSVRSTSTITK